MDEVKKFTENNEESKELLTHVTSVAQEEARTGQKIDLPSPEKLVERAATSYIQCMSILNQLWDKLSKKAAKRVFLAVMSLPEDKVPVLLKTEVERHCYGLGQKALMDRFTITIDHVSKEQTRIKAELAKKEQKNKGKITMLTEEESKKVLEEVKE